MKSIEALLRNKEFAASLLNGPCPSKKDKNDYTPINPDWIDEKASDAVTEAFHKLLPSNFPYITHIVVEKNPDTIYGGTCVDANEKRLRYFVITVIPDTEFPFDFSYPLIHEMWTVCLHCWEIMRAALAACTEDMRVVIATNPTPPILNNARLEWVSLYLGRQPYRGISRLSEQWAEGDEFDGLEADIHLYKVREMESDSVIQQLIDAYEKDYPENPMKISKTSGTAFIEFNHSGIPDDELHPEEFSEYQLAVLNSLPTERQEPILRGCPVKVIDMDTGDEIAAFNMKNVEPTEFQKQMLARALYESMQRYFSNPENEAKFREWQEKRKKDKDQN